MEVIIWFKIVLNIDRLQNLTQSALVAKHRHAEFVEGNIFGDGAIVAHHLGSDAVFGGLGQVMVLHKVVEELVESGHFINEREIVHSARALDLAGGKVLENSRALSVQLHDEILKLLLVQLEVLHD